ncbi:MAG: hypothetical protein H6Q17_565 [Bacteroidetes bacterium]|nr:hypothetical protein [Bacteroidota bacterium]
MDVIKNTSYNSIVEGMSGTAAAQTINGILTYEYGVTRYEFTADDVVNNVLTVNHGKSTLNVFATLYDSSWNQQNMNGLFQVVDSNNWTLSIPTTITEKFYLIVDYKP